MGQDCCTSPTLLNSAQLKNLEKSDEPDHKAITLPLYAEKAKTKYEKLSKITSKGEAETTYLVECAAD